MSATMQAALLQGPRTFEVTTMPIPEPGADEILVRTSACGICTSELDMWEGKAKGLEFPRFIGHEPSGIVEKTGTNVKEIRPGDRVAAWSEGKGYAEFFTAREEHVMKLLSDTRLDHALGEPIACATNGVRKADPQLNDSVCIVGCGFMGLIMLQVFRARGVGTIVAVDTRESILELALSLGATHGMNPKNMNVRKAVKDLTGGRGVDVGVEAAGLQQTLDLTTDLVRMEGKLEVFGFHQGEPRSVNWGYWNWMAFQIINGHVRSGSIYVEGMKVGLTLLERGLLKMDRLVTHHYSLSDINKAFQEGSAKEDGFVKGVVQFKI